MLVPAPRSSLAVRTLAIGAVCLAAVALHGAVRWYGRSFAGVLVTQDCVISSIGTPIWDGIRQGMRFPDRIVRVDGIELDHAGGEYRARRWDRAVEAATD